MHRYMHENMQINTDLQRHMIYARRHMNKHRSMHEKHRDQNRSINEDTQISLDLCSKIHR